jgi:hypothetical protein
MLHDILRAAPILAVGLTFALWFTAIPLLWATLLTALCAPTICLVQLLRNEVSAH